MPVPRKFQPYLWSVNIKNLDQEKDKAYIIHQLLHYGDLNAFKWLKKTYTLKQVKELFVKYPKKMYSARSFHFVSQYLLHFSDQSIDSKKYVQNI